MAMRGWRVYEIKQCLFGVLTMSHNRFVTIQFVKYAKEYVSGN